jgi:hypothetical protein
MPDEILAGRDITDLEIETNTKATQAKTVAQLSQGIDDVAAQVSSASMAGGPVSISSDTIVEPIPTPEPHPVPIPVPGTPPPPPPAQVSEGDSALPAEGGEGAPSDDEFTDAAESETAEGGGAVNGVVTEKEDDIVHSNGVVPEKAEDPSAEGSKLACHENVGCDGCHVGLFFPFVCISVF